MINGTYYQLTRNSKKRDFLRYVFFIARVVFITESASTAVIHSVHWSRSDLKQTLSIVQFLVSQLRQLVSLVFSLGFLYIFTCDKSVLFAFSKAKWLIEKFNILSNKFQICRPFMNTLRNPDFSKAPFFEPSANSNKINKKSFPFLSQTL